MNPLILYDGDCGLCQKSVRFVLDRDPGGRFRFAALQSDVGRQVLKAANLPEDFADSLVLVDDVGTHTHSTAAVRIARQLDGPARLLAVGRFVPRPLRDAAYRLVARNRFRFFGKGDACETATEAERARFIDA